MKIDTDEQLFLHRHLVELEARTVAQILPADGWEVAWDSGEVWPLALWATFNDGSVTGLAAVDNLWRVDEQAVHGEMREPGDPRARIHYTYRRAE